MSENNESRQGPETGPDVVRPVACLYCQHKDLEDVFIVARDGPVLMRAAEYLEKPFFKGHWVKKHALYGWRCLDCGYVMWFTQRFLD